ncbi:hypothetical protein HGRIS_006278 [Hohenbuehelia grisea]|uniref:Opioid growth factor receptor (OGFr) conserved domain-containing protein n=1 Tax=Hohenbuehelia grisea TaxID=104357 RepID=A0ABR3K131_9AGAR
MSIPRDVQDFLDGYPGQADKPNQSANFEFYSNLRRCQPDSLLIDELHDEWRGDYQTLEWNHGFIQWLFPIQEHGMNYQSQPLQAHEISLMKADATIMARMLDSYRLMLDFYGMRLVNPETGLVARVLPPKDFAPRYRNLCRSSHNNLRISRILKCLSELGLEHLNAGFLLHVLSEQSEHRELCSAAIRSSMDRWWANCIRNEEERDWIRVIIQKAHAGTNGYVFTRKLYEAALERRERTGSIIEAAAEVSDGK